MIEISNLSKSYANSKILDSISITFPNRGLYAIIGKSGAGKSTLLSLLGLMDDEYEGSIKVDNRELKELSEKEKEEYRFNYISFVFQNFSFNEEETVKQNFLKLTSIIDYSKDEEITKINYVLEKVGLKDKLYTTFKDLSGGEKKRISLARGLLKDSPILLLDEPLASLNKELRKEIVQLLLKESETKLVILITHETNTLPTQTTIFKLENGKLIFSNNTYKFKENSYVSFPRRKKYNITSAFINSFSFFKTNFFFAILIIVSYVISLFTISFSRQLSTSISSSLVKSFSTYMDDNALLIESKETAFTSSALENAEYEKLNYIRNKYPDEVISVSDFYLTSLNNIFKENQRISITYKNKTLKLNPLSLDSFINNVEFEEVDLQNEQIEMSDEEIALILNKEMMGGLYFLLFNERLTDIDKANIDTINSYLDLIVISLELKADKNDWNYHMNHSLRLKKVFLGEECKVINNNQNFRNNFVTYILHFKEKYDYEASEKPWTLIKESGVKIRQNKIIDFVIKFLRDEYLSSYIFNIAKENGYYIKDDKKTHNHITIYKNNLESLSVSKLEKKIKAEQNLFSNLSYSTPIYTYTSSGYISGFNKPFFFSKYKEKLNYIQDEYQKSDVDLGQFQSSLFTVDKEVIKADLLSSMNSKGITFQNYENKNLLYGEKPKSNNEIGISNSLAKSLFKKNESAINESLFTLTLSSTNKENSYYFNNFIQGELKITGIYDSDKLVIYQDALFPLAYYFSLAEMETYEIRVDNALVSVDLTSKDQNYYLNYFKDEYLYNLSFPMKEMVKEINNTLNRLSILFLSFSILCFISSFFLLSLALYLIIQKDNKNIAVLLTLGYKKDEIIFYYNFITLEIGIISYIFSLILSVFVETSLKSTLLSVLSVYTFNITPFLISFLAMIFLTTIASIFLKMTLRKISPKQALFSSKR